MRQIALEKIFSVLAEHSGRMVLVIMVGVLLIFAFSSYLLGSLGVFTASTSAIGGLWMVFFVLKTGDVEARVFWMANALFLWGACYLLLYAALAIKRIRLARKRRRREVGKRLCFTLPDRENTYVRARLNTTLKCEERGLEADMDISNDGRLIKLGHVIRLLEKVKKENLTRAEGLQVEELSRALSAYVYKEKWSAGDLVAVNEICAAIIKLSAKYTASVSV